MHIATEENNLMMQKDEKEKEKNVGSVIQPEKQPLTVVSSSLYKSF